MTPEISFVVPCYNYGRFLQDCLDGIFGQQGDWDFEVIAIDDASTDDTQAVLSRYSDPRLRCIAHSLNQGHVRTITEGLLACRGEFVARIDPDDRYHPGFLAQVVPKLREYPEVGLVYGHIHLIDEQGAITWTGADRHHAGRDFRGSEFIPLLRENFICAPTVIARRAAWLEALPVPPNLAFNDWYFTLMMARKYDFFYVNQVLADYRVHAANHHSKIVKDRSEETSIFQLLDSIFADQERSAEMQKQKQAARAGIYAYQYATLADKYFWAEMDEDARRCYLAAIRLSPPLLRSPGLLRRLAATCVNRAAYDRIKSIWKAMFGSLAGEHGLLP